MAQEHADMSHLFCFGLGYSAAELGRRLAARGWRVAGTSRTASGVARLKEQGFEGHVFSGSHHVSEVAAALRRASHVLVSIAPDAEGDPVLRSHERDLAGTPGLAWIGYLSTVGVYGDHAGGWVDEGTPSKPTSERSVRRAEAERRWLAFGAQSRRPVHIFRLAGIYGPGRNAVDNLRDGSARRIDKPGQVFNRIHVADIANVLDASIARPRAGAVYNVADNEPSPPQDVVAHAAELIGASVPPLIPFAEAKLSEMGRSFYAENKRVSNALIRDELGVVLAFPTYREGLAGILAEEQQAEAGGRS
jgi:nucleoside-diphosphate-sugar epimerase